METRTSVLQQIRKKEVELNVKIDEARRESEKIVANAKREAEEILKNAEVQGAKVAEEFYKKRYTRILNESENLKKLAAEELKSITVKGEQNLPKAIDRIITVVTLE